MNTIRSLYYRLFKHWRRLELEFLDYSEAERRLGTNLVCRGKPVGPQWRIAPEENHNHVFGRVWLERVERVTV